MAVYGWLLLPGWSFGWDFTNHLWLVGEQARYIADQHRPTEFVSSAVTGVLYPHYMFYGETAYVVTGAVGAFLSPAIGIERAVDLSYSATYVAAALFAYASIVMIGRVMGIRSWMSHVAAITFTCLPFRITVAYSGAWGEFVAPCGAVILLLAVALVWQGRARSLSVFLIAAAGEGLLSSAHGISFVWGNTMILAVSLAVLVGFVVRRALLRGQRLSGRSQCAAAAITGALIGCGANAWWIGPAVRYRDTLRVSDWLMTGEARAASLGYSSLVNVLSPWLRDPVDQDMSHLYVQLPSVLMAWAIACFGLAMWLRCTSRRYAVIAGAASALVVGLYLLADGRLWGDLPPVLQIVQYPHRVWTYGSAAATVLVAAAAGQLQTMSRRRGVLVLRWILVVALIVAFCSGVYQAVSVPGHTGRPREAAAAGTPVFWYDPGIFRQRGSVDANGIGAAEELHFVVRRGRAAVVGHFQDGKPYRTNLALPEILFSSRDTRLVGYDNKGFAVLASDGDKRLLIVKPSYPPFVVACRLVSFACAVVIVALGAAWLLLRLRRRRQVHLAHRPVGVPS